MGSYINFRQSVAEMPLAEKTQQNSPSRLQHKAANGRAMIRGAGRLSLFAATLGAAALDYIVRLWLTGRHRAGRKRSEWCARWARGILRVLNIKAQYAGQPPVTGLLVSNHLSYLDILVLAARQPAVFVAKSEVQQWPVIGFLTRWAGTLFIRREKRGDVSPINQQMTALVQTGIVVIVFPEGTSSGGISVLPFYSSLLEPAAVSGCNVTPAFIRYELADGSVADEVCYWRDMTFVKHFWNLLQKRSVQAQVSYGLPQQAIRDRKRLARDLWQAVTNLNKSEILRRSDDASERSLGCTVVSPLPPV